MNNKITPNSCYEMMPSSNGNVVSSVLSALPMAIVRPLLEYRRMDVQIDIIIRAIEANERTREDIMKTIRELGTAGKLTPELTQYLFAAYNQALIQM